MRCESAEGIPCSKEIACGNKAIAIAYPPLGNRPSWRRPFIVLRRCFQETWGRARESCLGVIGRFRISDISNGIVGCFPRRPYSMSKLKWAHSYWTGRGTQ